MADKQVKSFDIKKFIIGFVITTVITTLVAATLFGLTVLSNTGANKSWDYEIYENLINAFTIAGGLGILFYLLSLLATAGAFDIIGYSAKLVWYNTFHRNIRDTALPKTYAEYKQLKRGKKPNSTIYMLLGSLPCLVTGLIIMIPYYINVR